MRYCIIRGIHWWTQWCREHSVPSIISSLGHRINPWVFFYIFVWYVPHQWFLHHSEVFQKFSRSYWVQLLEERTRIRYHNQTEQFGLIHMYEKINSALHNCHFRCARYCLQHNIFLLKRPLACVLLNWLICITSTDIIACIRNFGSGSG